MYYIYIYMGCGRCDAAPSLLSSCERVGVGNACGADDQRELAGFATLAEIKKRKRAVSMHAARRRRRAATRSVAGSLAEAAAHCSRQMLSGSTLLRTRCCAGSCVCVDSIQILRYQTSARTLNECQVGVDYIAAKGRGWSHSSIWAVLFLQVYSRLLDAFCTKCP